MAMPWYVISEAIATARLPDQHDRRNAALDGSPHVAGGVQMMGYPALRITPPHGVGRQRVARALESVDADLRPMGEAASIADRPKRQRAREQPGTGDRYPGSEPGVSHGMPEERLEVSIGALAWTKLGSAGEIRNLRRRRGDAGIPAAPAPVRPLDPVARLAPVMEGAQERERHQPLGGDGHGDQRPVKRVEGSQAPVSPFEICVPPPGEVEHTVGEPYPEKRADPLRFGRRVRE